MAERFTEITPKIWKFIDKQQLFFVATAPLGEGRVNVSPKGYKDTFTVVDEHTFAYLELYGSGIETKAHLGQNSRITVMFCSFDRESNVVRLYGRGRWLRPDDPEFEQFAPRFNLGHASPRGIVVVDVESTQTSCGYAVPYLEPRGERPVLDTYHDRRTPEQWRERVTGPLSKSIDGLPGLDPDHPLPTEVRRRPVG